MALTAYNVGLATAQGTLGTSLAAAADTRTTSLAAAGRDFAEDAAGAEQAFRETIANSVKTRNDTVADAGKAFADAVASAARPHADDTWSAWETERVGALAAAVTHVKALMGSAQTFSDAVALRAEQEAIAVGTARGEAVEAFAAADNHAEAGVFGAQQDRLTEWHSQVTAGVGGTEGGLLPDGRYLAFFPVHEAALDSLVMRVWEGALQHFAPLVSAAEHFSQGDLMEGFRDVGGYVNANLDALQLMLDVAGLTPGVGIFADGANTLISLLRGNWGEAALNAGAMIPGLGQGVTLAKFAAAAGPVAGMALKYGDEAAAGITKASDEAANVVYRSVDDAGNVQYVGITNNLNRRSADHLREKGIDIEEVMGFLSRADARAVEQALIETHQLGKNGGTLMNIVNSISRRNPLYGKRLERGFELLNSIGY